MRVDIPLVSVVMPTYNRAYIIESAIQSVLDQTVEAWELIIIDDGSSDGTSDVITAINDKRIRLIRQSNQGPAVARNRAVIEFASAEWIAYLDSDNELFPNYIERMLHNVNKRAEVKFAVPRARRTQELYEDGELVCLIDDSADTPPELSLNDIFMKRLHLDTNGFMHRRSLFAEDGVRWDPECRAMEDWELAMSIGERYPDGFCYVPEVLYAYHQRYGGDGIVSSLGYGDWAEVFEYIYRKHEGSSHLRDQDWYPQRVEKWKALQREFELGNLPPYTHYYFRDLLKS